MSHTPTPLPRRRRGTSRRLLAAPVLGLLAAVALLLFPALAAADTASTLTVDGTSDVSDSGLMSKLIQPEFSAAYPQYTFKYNGSATGVALNNARTGTGGPSVLIVHAPSLENQFVAGGFSYGNRYGNAIFRNDFVVAGPTADSSHANVLSNGANNVAQAFADIAAAGVAGNATFFTRGGNTTAPGTVVAEHQIWALIASAGLTPAGVVLCNVDPVNDGGGMSPINPSVHPTSGQPCPDSGTVDGTNGDLPSWYKINAGNQAANVLATNACTGTGVVAGSCYSLTDRGTFDFLASGTDPAGTTPNLQIVTRDNGAAAPGGANALINYFHAYIINPASPGETVNLSAAIAFVNFLTSPAFQAQLQGYLPNSDPGGPPFVADASPTITASGFPTAVGAGRAITVTGHVTNNEIGFPAIAGKPVELDQLAGTVAVPVAAGRTDASGNYAITFTPRSSGSFQVATGEISQIEDSSLSPPYGDILSPAASAASPVAVNGTASIDRTTTSVGAVEVSGTVGPAAVDANAKVTLLARQQGSTGAFAPVTAVSLSPPQSTYAINGSLAAGKYTIEVQYADPGALNTATSATTDVTVPARGPVVKYRKVKITNGVLTLTGTLSRAPGGSRATVKLYARTLRKLPTTSAKRGSRALASVAKHKPRFRQVAQTTVKVGRKSFTLKHRFKRGYVYVLQLAYYHKGQSTTHSRFRTVVIR